MNVKKFLGYSALLAFLLLVLLGVTTARAPLANAQEAHAVKHTFTGKTRTLKPIGITRFAATEAAPTHTAADRSEKAKINRVAPRHKSPAQQPNIPTVNATPIDAVNHPGGVNAAAGLNAFDTWQVNEAVFQPPDQGLCAGNGFVLELVNEVVAIYDSKLQKIAGNMSLNQFFQTDSALGDPKCYYDPGTKRFFATQLVTGGGEGPEGDGGDGKAPVNKQDTVDASTFVYIAVSMTQDPRLGWTVYALDTTFDCPAGAEPCLGDQPLIGANQDAFIISTNVFQLEGPNFYGASLYVFDKKQLAIGSLADLVNYAYLPVGQDLNTPDDVCCWYSVQPAFAARKSDWDKSHGGVEYFMSALDLFNEGDTRVAVWALSNTQSLHAAPYNYSLNLDIAIVNSQAYIIPQDFSKQKDDGKYPYGQVFFGVTQAGPIQPNDDRMNQVFQVNGTLWSGVNTGLMQKGANGKSTYHNGIAYFALMPKWKGNSLKPQWVQNGYISPQRADALFPSIAINSHNRGVMVYSLTGNNYYPSAAYTLLDAARDPGSNQVYVSLPGKSSYDGSCEYNPACGGGELDPRWGDYSAAVIMNNMPVVATEYIQQPDCDVATYLAEGPNLQDPSGPLPPFPTCGDTRAWRQNWGTGLATFASP